MSNLFDSDELRPTSNGGAVPSTAIDREFSQFWAAYPLKVGRLAAIREFRKARTKATTAEILAGVQAYIENKPEDRDWCQPRTFLFQGRWMDEYETVTAHKRREDDCPHTPECHNKTWCRVVKARESGAA